MSSSPYAYCHQISSIFQSCAVASDPCPDLASADASARHRYASSLASAIKRAGYPHELDSAQLLYPQEREAQWLVDWLEARRTTSRSLEEETPVKTEAMLQAWMGSAKVGRRRKEGRASGEEMPGGADRSGERKEGQRRASGEERMGVGSATDRSKQGIEAPSDEREKSHASAWELMPGVELGSAADKIRKRKDESREEASVGEIISVIESGSADNKGKSGEEEMQLRQREEAIRGLNERWRAANEAYAADAARLGRIESVIRANMIENEFLKDKLKACEKARLLSKADAVGNATKLDEIVTASKARLMGLVAEWETHRVPLVQSVKAEKCFLFERKKLTSEIIESIAQARNEFAEIQSRLAISTSISDGDFVSPRIKFTPGKGSELRSSVSARVLDSVKQLAKQTNELQRVVDDVKVLQKEVTFASEGLLSIEKQTDDLIFATAKTNPCGVSAYEFFVDVRDKFDELVQIEQRAYIVDMESRDKASKCHAMAARVSVLNVEAMEADIAKIKNENELSLQRHANIVQ